MGIRFAEFDKSIHEEAWRDVQMRSNERSFLTTLEWIDFQKSYGKESQQFILLEDEKVIGLLYIEIARRTIAKFAYCPHGPVLLPGYESSSDVFKAIAGFGKELIRKENLNVFRINPLIEKNNMPFLKSAGWGSSYALGQAKHQWVMDISSDEEEILKLLKKDTRYYINRGKKSGIIVRKVSEESQVDDFLKLMNETKSRQNFSNYNDEYYKDQWRALNPVGMTEIFIAYYNNIPVAASLMNYFDKSVYYAHAASTSDPELAKLAAPYYLHWEMIRDAKQRDITTYDFWGVVPKGIAHPWRGLSDFKMKFSGALVSLVGVVEVHNVSLMYYIQNLYDWWTYRKDRN